MGKPGPKKTPTRILKKRGSWREEGRGLELQPPAGVPTCPDWLGDVGRAKWNERIEILSQTEGLVTKLDGDFLALYCEAFKEFIDARLQIDREGATCVSEKGGEYQHPAVGRKNKAIERMRRFGALFGMSPSDRVSLNISGEDGETDPLARLLRKRGSLN
jgi:P27 family predicted phage terminase small subunit